MISTLLTAILVICLLLFVSVINSFVIMGAFNAAHEVDGYGNKFILNPVYVLIERVLGSYWSKPFLGCYKCMASIWGGLPFFISMLLLDPLEFSNTNIDIILKAVPSYAAMAFLYTCVVSAVVSYIYAGFMYYEETAFLRMKQKKAIEEEQEAKNNPFVGALPSDDSIDYLKHPVMVSSTYLPDTSEVTSITK